MRTHRPAAGAVPRLVQAHRLVQVLGLTSAELAPGLLSRASRLPPVSPHAQQRCKAGCRTRCWNATRCARQHPHTPTGCHSITTSVLCCWCEACARRVTPLSSSRITSVPSCRVSRDVVDRSAAPLKHSGAQQTLAADRPACPVPQACPVCALAHRRVQGCPAAGRGGRATLAHQSSVLFCTLSRRAASAVAAAGSKQTVSAGVSAATYKPPTCGGRSHAGWHPISTRV